MSSEPSVTKFFTWKIPNITKDSLSNKEITIDIDSECFAIIVDEHFTKWILNFSIDATDLTINLDLLDFSTLDFETVCKYNIVTSKGIFTFVRKLFSKGREFTEQRSKWPSLLKRNKLLDKFSDYVVDGNLTVFAELKITLLAPTEVQAPISQDRKKLVASYKKMFQNQILSDFELRANDGKKFRCHKAVLASNSQVFYQMLTSKMKESKEGFCLIPDFDSETVEAMLKFIYFWEVENLDEISAKLIYAAEKYQLDELKTECINSMVKMIYEEDVVDVLEISEEITDSSTLVYKCVAIILKSYNKIRETEEWQSMPQSLFRKVTDLIINAQQNHIELFCEK